MGSEALKKGLVFEVHGHFIHMRKFQLFLEIFFELIYKSEDISAVSVHTTSEKGR